MPISAIEEGVFKIDDQLKLRINSDRSVRAIALASLKSIAAHVVTSDVLTPDRSADFDEMLRQKSETSDFRPGKLTKVR